MKSALFASASMLALTLGAMGLFRERPPSRPAGDLSFARAKTWEGPHRAPSPPEDWERSGGPETADVTRNFLLYFVVPLWACAGIADWLCHRATSIETTSGARESVIHLVMLVEMAIPVLAGLFLEITSPIIALMIASFLLHEVTALWDVSYAVTRRHVTPIEQHVHSFLELLPLMALSFVIVLHWPRFRALVTGTADESDAAIRVREKPLPRGYIAWVVGTMTFVEALPYLEELSRCLGASDFHLVPPTRREERSTAAAPA